MTTEQILRDQLDRATHDVVGGPDLEAAMRRGRRRRRTTRVGVAVAAVAVLGVGAVGVRALTSDSETVVRDAPVAAAPADETSDFVPGTGIDEALAAVVASHLPALPSPDDVYPSDSDTAGPLPDADFAGAEDWQAAYTLGGDHEFLLMTALASEGPFSCQGCDHQAVPGGAVYRQVSQSLETGKWQYATWFVRDDGSSVGAFEYAPGVMDEPDPRAGTLSDADIDALVQDPALTLAALSVA